MTRIISLVNQKGGVGKTTTAINLSSYLGNAGKSVLLCDIDPQANATSGVGFKVDENTKGIYESLIGQVNIKDIIHQVPGEKFKIVPSTPSLAGANVELVNVENREFKLQESLSIIRDNFDYIIIDCPPSLGLLTINALVASDFVLIPVQCEYYALEGLGQLLNTINLVQQNLKPELQLMGAVLTMYDKKTRLSNQVVKEIRRYFPAKVFDSIIPRNVRLSESPSFGKSIRRYDGWSKGARAYKGLAEEILRYEK